MLLTSKGCVAAVTLTQPSSAQAEPGSSLTLDCVGSGYNTNAHRFSWIRQGPGKSLAWLAALRTGYAVYVEDEFKGGVTPSTRGSAGFTGSRARAEKGLRPAPLALSPTTRLAPHPTACSSWPARRLAEGSSTPPGPTSCSSLPAGQTPGHLWLQACGAPLWRGNNVEGLAGPLQASASEGPRPGQVLAWLILPFPRGRSDSRPWDQPWLRCWLSPADTVASQQGRAAAVMSENHTDFRFQRKAQLKCCMATVTFTQPGSAQAKPQSSITLDCVVSGYNINDHHLSWIRQAPGKSLVWLAAFRTGYTTYIADEFKGRVTPSTSGSTARLKIDRLTTADTATYYCARNTQWLLPGFLSNNIPRGTGLCSLNRFFSLHELHPHHKDSRGAQYHWSPSSVLRVRVPWGTGLALLPLQWVGFYPERFRALVSAIAVSVLQIKW
ncbi:unnamed protein product [Caretta caretta]